MWGHGKKVAICSPWRELSPGPDPANTLPVGFIASSTVRKHISVVSASQAVVFWYGSLSGWISTLKWGFCIKKKTIGWAYMKISLKMEFQSWWQSGIGTPFLDLQRVLIILEAGFIRGIAKHVCTRMQYQDSWMANTFTETEKICGYKHISFIQWVGINHKLRVYSGEGNGTPLQYIAWKTPWMEEPGGLQSMRSLRVGHDWETSLSLSTFMHWRRKWQPIPVFLPGESQARGSLVGCCLWGCTELDMTEET